MKVTRAPSGGQYSVDCETDTGWEDNLACLVGEDAKCGQKSMYTDIPRHAQYVGACLRYNNDCFLIESL